MEEAMFRRSGFLVTPLLSCLFGFLTVWAVWPAPAADKPSPDRTSQVMRWDDATSRPARWGETRQYSDGKTFATEDVFVATVVVQPGKSNHKSHRHAEEEYMVLVDGTGTWSLDGKTFAAQRGDIVYAEPWVYHGFTNTSDKPTVYVVIRYKGKGVPRTAQPDDRPNELTGPVSAKRPLAELPTAGIAVASRICVGPERSGGWLDRNWELCRLPGPVGGTL
jgi:quercetin dioxygenase-like cupin family protein